MSRYHEFNPGWTGMSSTCNELVTDAAGYGIDCGLPVFHHIHYVPQHMEVYEESRDRYVRNNRAECDCWKRPSQTDYSDGVCPKSEVYPLYGAKHKREVTDE